MPPPTKLSEVETAVRLVSSGAKWEASDPTEALAYYSAALEKLIGYLPRASEYSEEGKMIRTLIENTISRGEIMKQEIDSNFRPYDASAVPPPVRGPLGETIVASSEAPVDVPRRPATHQAVPPISPAKSFASTRVDPKRAGAVHWSDVAGLESAKESLSEAAILPQRFPCLFTGKRKPWKGILLYGPPGTGKSHLAAALASEAKVRFFSVTASDLLSKWQGESAKQVRALFEEARACSPSIIFIDEVDALCGARSSEDSTSTSQVKTEILTQVDGIPSIAGGGQGCVLLLGATNLPWNIDQAMRRRFEKRIYIPLPRKGARRRMFELHSEGVECLLGKDDLERFAAATEGFSGSDIKVATRDALMGPVRRVQKATHFTLDVLRGPALPVEPGALLPVVPCSPDADGAFACTYDTLPPHVELTAPPVTVEDFEVAIGQTKASVSTLDLAAFELWTKEFGAEGE